ncbi:MAG: FAD-dependent oxidoreductase [Ilumatobacteraceae bacterium]
MPDVVVVGAGMAGAAAAWVLARRGRAVLLVDRFARGHDRGSSHGAERIFRFGYTDPAYVRLAQDSVAGWHDLQAPLDAPLLHLTGVVDHGDDAELDELLAACTAAGVRVDALTASEASARWPGLRFDGNVVQQPDAGRVDADRTLAACWDQAESLGADVRFGAPVTAVRRPRAGDGVEVQIGDEIVTAPVAVVAAAGWTAELLEPDVAAALVPPITVSAETVAWFRPGVEPWPSFIQRGDEVAYGLGSPDGLVKVGLHGIGPVIEPDDRPATVPGAVRAIEDYASRWLPGVEPTAVRSTVCLYASSATDDFVLDRRGPIVVGVGFGGHGFKFAPAIGAHLADLADEALGLQPAGERAFPAEQVLGATGRPHSWR